MDNVEILLRRSRENGKTKYSWQAPNGRQFVIDKMPNDQFFLYEMKPNGVIVQNTTRGLEFDSTSEKSLRLQELTSQPPSVFFEALREMSLSTDVLVSFGSGHGMGSIYLDTLDECKREITKALSQDRWYRAFDPDKARKKAQERKMSGEDARQSLAYWEHKLADLMPKDDGRPALFQGFSSIFGDFPKESRDRIMSFINAPSAETWDNVADLILIGGKTCWQIWVASDPNAPLSIPEDHTWTHWPEPEDFLRYTETVRNQEIAKAKAKIIEAKKELALLEDNDPLTPASLDPNPEPH